MSTQNTENTMSLYWFGPPESNTLRPVVGVDCLRIGRMLQGVASFALYWLADEVGSQTPCGLRPGDLSSTLHILPYPIDLLQAKSTEVLSCLVRQVLRS
jgi:hypothetical protein